MYITFSVKLHSAIFSAASSMVDTRPMCVCPCNPISTRSQSTSLRHYLTSGAIITSSTLEKSSPLFYISTTTTTSTTSVPASLRTSVCYCLCSSTSLTTFLLCKYVNRNTLAFSQNFLEKLNEKKNFACWHAAGTVNEEQPNPASYALNCYKSFCSPLFQHQKISWQILPKVCHRLQLV